MPLDFISGLKNRIGTRAVSKLEIDNSTGSITLTLANGKAFLFSADNQIDIGASGASRPRNVYIGGNLTVSGTTTSVVNETTSGTVAITTSSATAFTVAKTGTNYVFQVDTSTTSAATGIKIKGAAAAAGVALSVISSGADENLSIDAKGSGTIVLAGTSTGGITLTTTTTVSGALNITNSSATALSVAKTGTNYALQVDTSVASAATGIKITSAAAAGGIAIAAISSGAAENLTLDAKGTGLITIGGTSTGGVTLGGAIGLTGTIQFTDTDVVHGITDVGSTNSYGILTEENASNGGLTIKGLSDDAGQPGLQLQGFIGVADPTDSTPAIKLTGFKKAGAGAGIQALAAAETTLEITNNTTSLLTINGAGQVALPVQGSTGGVLIGTDSNLYRNAANVLKTDDALIIAGLLTSEVNLVVGTGEAGASPSGSIVRAPNASSAGNVNGADLTIAAGKSSMSGTGGEIIFQLPYSAGTNPNPLVSVGAWALIESAPSSVYRSGLVVGQTTLPLATTLTGGVLNPGWETSHIDIKGTGAYLTFRNSTTDAVEWILYNNSYNLYGGTAAGILFATFNTSTGLIAFPSATTLAASIQIGGDVNLYRSAANILYTPDAFTIAGLLTSEVNLVVGTGEAGATPVGSVLRGPNAAGTDIAGAALTIAGGRSTGTGAAGALIFQVSPAAAGTGSSLNALTEVLKLSNVTTAPAVGFFGVTPAVRATTYTQTYSTADKTHANSTFAAVSETASTQTTPWGYATQAQADAITVELNDLNDDVVDLKQLVNSIIDDLQAYGLLQ